MNYFKSIYEKNEKDINLIKNIISSYVNNLSSNDFDRLMQIVYISTEKSTIKPDEVIKKIVNSINYKLHRKNSNFICSYASGSGSVYSLGHRLIVDVLNDDKRGIKNSLVFNVNYDKNVYFSQIDFINLDKITNSCIEFSFRNESTTFKIVDNNLNQINEYSYSYNKKSYFKFCKDYKHDNSYIFKGSKIEELSLALNFCYNLNRTDTSFLTNILFDNMLDKKSIQQEIKDLFLLKYDIIISDYKDLINIDEKLKLIDNNLNLKAIKNRFNNFFKKT